MAIDLVKEPTSQNFDLGKKPNPKKPGGGIGFSEPSGGLVPIGDTGLWITPDEPADPEDCERWPDSPYCSLFFFTLTPASLVPSIAIDACNLGIRLDMSLGFYKLPPVSLVYRDSKPECDPNYSPPIEPLPEPPRDGANRPFAVLMPKHPDCLGFASFHYYVRYGSYGDGEETFSGLPPDLENYYRVNPVESGFFNSYGIGFHHEYFMLDGETDGSHPSYSIYLSYVAYYPGNLRNGYLYHPYSSESPVALTSNSLAYCPPAPDRPILPPPPPIEDNPPPRQCCMSCCPSRSEQDNSLLNLLIQKVDKLSSIVGIDDYPVSLPASLISRDEGFLGNLIPNQNMSVPSLTRFLAWYIERFDEIMGQWEIPIEVKDSDPTKPGDQPVGFKLPNMAEAIAEMFGLMLQTSINSQIAINMQTRTMLEVGQNKQQGFKAYMLVLAIADHLGFDYKEIKHKIPMLFDINQTQLDKLLQESEIEVTAVEYTDKEDLKTVLLELRQAAAIIRAVHWRKFDLNSDIAQGVKDLIMGLVKTSDEVNDNKDDDDSGKDKFDDFLEDVERGFTTSSGITDPDHPYGRNYKERPRIKEIGQESPGV